MGAFCPETLFPLPRLNVGSLCGGQLGRGVRQRIGARLQEDMDGDRCLASVNQLATRQQWLHWEWVVAVSHCRWHRLQLCSMLIFFVNMLGGPQLTFLCRSASAASHRATVRWQCQCPGSYLSADVSLPAPGNCAVPLANYRGNGGVRVFDDFVKNHVHTHQIATVKKADIGLKAPYNDPELLRGRRCAQFIQSLRTCRRGKIAQDAQPLLERGSEDNREPWTW